MKILFVSAGMERKQFMNVDGETLRYDNHVISDSEEAIMLAAENLHSFCHSVYVSFPMASNCKYNSVYYFNLYIKQNNKLSIDILFLTDLFYRFDLLYDIIDFSKIKKIGIWLHTDNFENKNRIVKLQKDLQKVLKRNISMFVIYSYDFQKTIVDCPNGFESFTVYKDIIHDIIKNEDKENIVLLNFSYEISIPSDLVYVNIGKESKWNTYKLLSKSKYMICNKNNMNTFEFINMIFECIMNKVIVITYYRLEIYHTFKDNIIYVNNNDNNDDDNDEFTNEKLFKMAIDKIILMNDDVEFLNNLSKKAIKTLRNY